jgi:hypothetical protein
MARNPRLALIVYSFFMSISSSGSGARGAGRSCDFLSDSIATVSPRAKIRCVLDGIDLVPYWVNSPECFSTDHKSKEESQKFLWGREDDTSCLDKNRDVVLNSSELSVRCGGIFSKYWKDVETPVFLITTQLEPTNFKATTCGVSAARNEDYSDYTIGWRQGMLALAEAISLYKPENGWFIPNCDNVPFLLDGSYSKERRTVTVPLLQEDQKMVNALQVF